MINMSVKTKGSPTGVIGIRVHLASHRTPRYSARYKRKYLGSFSTLDQAQAARLLADTLVKQGKPLPSVPRWREQVGTTGIKESTVAGLTLYRYEVNVTQSNGKTIPFRSQWFKSAGEALVARMKALDLVNEGKPIGRDGANWKELRYPIQWIRTVLSPLPSSDITLAEWAILVFRQIILPASIPDKVKTRYDAHLRKHIVPALGSYKVSSLNEQVVTLLDRHLEQRGLAASKKSVRTTLWRIMESAITNGIRPDNPVVYTPLPERLLKYRQAQAKRRRESLPLPMDATL